MTDDVGAFRKFIFPSLKELQGKLSSPLFVDVVARNEAHLSSIEKNLHLEFDCALFDDSLDRQLSEVIGLCRAFGSSSETTSQNLPV